MDHVSAVALGDAGLVAIALLLASYEAWLYWHRPNHREHLWLTIMCLMTAGHAFALMLHYDASPSVVLKLLKWELATMIVLCHCAPLLAMALLNKPMAVPKWLIYGSALFWLALVPTPWIVPDQLEFRDYWLLDQPFPRRVDTLLSGVGTGFALAFIFGTAWWMWRNREERRRESQHFTLGVVGWALVAIHSGVFGALGLPMPASTFEYGFVFFALALVASDARRYMRMLTSSERDFRAVVAGSPEAIAIVQAGAIRHANPAFLDALGFEDTDSVHGRTLASVIHPADAAEVEAMLDQTVASRLVTARFQRADEDLVELELVALPIELDDAPASVLLARNVTERKRLTARTMEMDRIISMGTLAAGIGHEINNPLNYVLLNLEEAQRHLRGMGGAATGERLPECVDSSLDGVQRIRTIVDGLARFSRADQQQAPLLLDQVIRTAADITANQIKLRARLELDLEPDLRVLANETRLVQVFVNLLVNAAQAIPEGHVDDNMVRVSTRALEGLVVCEVSDTGVGMSEEQRGRIFEPFFTTKPRGEGTGLGLGICRDSVQLMGGAIWVESTEGEGTTFVIELPVSDEPLSQEDRPESLPPPRKLRILVVDDEPQLLQSMTRLIGLWADVAAASSAEEAMAVIAEAEPFDLILSDLMMPDRSGMDLYRDAIADDPDLADRFAFMTGGTFTADAHAFRASATGEFLDKPVSSRDLKALLKRVEPRNG
ncbi:MAG: hybrid sensor histidine kinase/response regulator [Deltaproteobacteria bacterium]|jgi:PAS domain S-box-containing protein|nr:hybrid sensor histidine kinase/response regulator [Deltaproteobacteria bacterium]MBW2533805.1 hybrid sensor histidine kinase/response regulator [Deltaproteobacteria bacterium]